MEARSVEARPARPGRHTLDGTVRVFLAESLALPTGLLIAAFLGRWLGPEGYGLFILALTLAAWVEWSVTSVFARATIKFVGEAEDWRPLGAAVVRLHLVIGGAAAALLWLLSDPLSALLGEPSLAHYLRLFALDIPLFSLAHAHRNILVGLGGFRQRALASVGRLTARLLLIVGLVGLGLSVEGAILGSIGASLVELAVYRFYVRPPLFRPGAAPIRPLLGYALPLFLTAVAARLYDKLDLFALKALGGTAEEAGVYGAAQTVAQAPGLVALAFSPLLLATLSRLRRDGDDRMAGALARDAMRAVIVLLPFAGLMAGAAPEIVGLVFGPAFAGAGPLLAALIFGALALVMVSVATAILTAAGKPAWTVALTAPLLGFALAGHILVIPRFGALGASLVESGFAVLGSLAAVLAVRRAWQVLPPAGTVWRSLVVCGGVYAPAALWPAGGLLLLLKLPALGVVAVLALLLLGEFRADEIALVRAAIPGLATRAPSPRRA